MYIDGHGPIKGIFHIGMTPEARLNWVQQKCKPMCSSWDFLLVIGVHPRLTISRQAEGITQNLEVKVTDRHLLLNFN